MLMKSSIPIFLGLTSFAYSRTIEYSTVTGYFLQDQNSTNATTFDFTATNFGLINQTYTNEPSTASSSPNANLTQWQRFTHEVTRLNHAAPKGTSYKVLFMGRHGEGYHNVAESYYGTPAWNCYYSLLPGNDTVTWADAHLTPTGIQQALRVNAFWRHQLSVAKTPAPEAYYVSPLYRCLQTANYSFSGLEELMPRQRPFVPTVKELLREGISLHTCDHRGNRSVIRHAFPEYRIEKGFSEYDQLWTGVYGETPEGEDVRSKKVLDEILGGGSARASTWISITSHSGEIASLLRVLGHRTFSLSTGAVIPVLVRVRVVQEGQGTMTATATATGPASTVSKYCAGPPVTSVSGGDCVCQSTSTGTGMGVVRVREAVVTGGAEL